jgi:hypothetical protein
MSKAVQTKVLPIAHMMHTTPVYDNIPSRFMLAAQVKFKQVTVASE